MDESPSTSVTTVSDKSKDPVVLSSNAIDYSSEWEQELTETVFLPKYAKQPNFKAYRNEASKFGSGRAYLHGLLSLITCSERKALMDKYLAAKSPVVAATWFNEIYPGRLTKPLAPRTVVLLYTAYQKLQTFRLEFERYDKCIDSDDAVLQPILHKITKYLSKIDETKDPERISKAQLLNTLLMKYVARLKEVEDAQPTAVDSRLEKMVQEYIGEIQKLVLQLHELATEKVNVIEVETIVRGEISYVLDAVKVVVLELFPEQYDFFIKKLRSRLTEKGLLPTEFSKNEGKKP